MTPRRVVHLELHTHDREAASAFYSDVLRWRTEQIDNRWGSYHALLIGGGLDAGIVECGTQRSGWLPYVDVDRIEDCHRMRLWPRGVPAPRAARGARGLALGGVDAGGWRDRVLAAEAMSVEEQTYGEQLEPHRGALHAHCYRMLGSVQDAEDAVQETLVRAWRGLEQFEGRSSLRSWLYSIATNVCLRMIERRPSRVLPLDYGPPADPHAPLGAPLVESTWIEPYPDAHLEAGFAGPEARYEQHEAVELAFIAALQHLPSRQRAVLILRDVLGFSGTEVGAMLDASPASIYSLLQRAHASIDGRLPERSQQATLRSLGDERLATVVNRYVEAWNHSDVDAIVDLLTDSATLAMPPTPTWWRGPDAIATGLRTGPLDGTRSWRLVPTTANGQPAAGAYLLDGSGVYLPHSLVVLTLWGDRIDDMNAFHVVASPERLGLGSMLQ